MIAPVGQFYLRNHHEEPSLTLSNWKLTVEGKVARPLQLTFNDLLEVPTVASIGMTRNCRASQVHMAGSSGTSLGMQRGASMR
jgi:sulfite oxidase